MPIPLQIPGLLFFFQWTQYHNVAGTSQDLGVTGCDVLQMIRFLQCVELEEAVMNWLKNEWRSAQAAGMKANYPNQEFLFLNLLKV